jgi:hypothetical protein
VGAAVEGLSNAVLLDRLAYGLYFATAVTFVLICVEGWDYYQTRKKIHAEELARKGQTKGG